MTKKTANDRQDPIGDPVMKTFLSQLGFMKSAALVPVLAGPWFVSACGGDTDAEASSAGEPAQNMLTLSCDKEYDDEYLDNVTLYAEAKIPGYDPREPTPMAVVLCDRESWDGHRWTRDVLTPPDLACGFPNKGDEVQLDVGTIRVRCGHRTDQTGYRYTVFVTYD